MGRAIIRRKKPADSPSPTGPPRPLTARLLDDLTEALTAVLRTDEIRGLTRPRESLVDALKQTDHLWPYTLDVYEKLEGPPKAPDDLSALEND